MRWDDIDKQVCSVARALSVVGERWTMLIIRDAFLGTRRFDQFQGLGLYPVLMSLARWGDDWMDKDQGAPLEYVHQACGKKTRPVLACNECGEPLKPEAVTPQLGPALSALAERLVEQGENIRDIPPLLKLSM